MVPEGWKLSTIDEISIVSSGINHLPQISETTLILQPASAKTGDKSTHSLKYSLPIDYRSSIK